jgi:hypothetical protein
MGAKSERVSCLSSIYTAATLKRSGSIHLGFYIFCPEWRNIFIYSAAVVAAATAAGPA